MGFLLKSVGMKMVGTKIIKMVGTKIKMVGMKIIKMVGIKMCNKTIIRSRREWNFKLTTNMKAINASKALVRSPGAQSQRRCLNPVDMRMEVIVMRAGLLRQVSRAVVMISTRAMYIMMMMNIMNPMMKSYGILLVNG